MSAANDRQEGGNHYRNLRQQHWDRIVELFSWPGARAYFVGCITKYLERAHLKNGVQDLLKARHYLDKLIELETQHDPQRIPGNSSPLRGRPDPEPGPPSELIHGGDEG